VAIDELVLRSANIHLSANGDGELSWEASFEFELAINEKFARNCTSQSAQIPPTEEPGYSAVDFEVTGTVRTTKTNLLEKVVGRDLKDLVNSFLGEKATSRKEKGAPTNVGESSPALSRHSASAAVPSRPIPHESDRRSRRRRSAYLAEKRRFAHVWGRVKRRF